MKMIECEWTTKGKNGEEVRRYISIGRGDFIGLICVSASVAFLVWALTK